MNKSQLIEKIYDKLKGKYDECTYDNCRVIITAMFDTLKNIIERQGSVQLRGLGTFKVVLSPPTERINPQTGKKIFVGSKKRVRFKASQNLQ